MKVISCQQVKFEVKPSSPYLVCQIEDGELKTKLLVTNVKGDRNETLMSCFDEKGKQHHYRIVADIETYELRQLLESKF